MTHLENFFGAFIFWIGEWESEIGMIDGVYFVNMMQESEWEWEWYVYFANMRY